MEGLVRGSSANVEAALLGGTDNGLGGSRDLLHDVVGVDARVGGTLVVLPNGVCRNAGLAIPMTFIWFITWLVYR